MHHSDGGVLASSSFGKALLSGQLPLPPNEGLPETNICLPYVFESDQAFALKPYMMRPYSSQHLNTRRRIFNYRLSRGRRIVENAFEILSARWRILRKQLHAKISTVDNIVKAACVLHNYIMLDKIDYQGDRDEPEGFTPGN